MLKKAKNKIKLTHVPKLDMQRREINQMRQEEQK